MKRVATAASALAICLASPAAAQSSNIVYLVCKQASSEEQVPFYLTIDYSANTVTTMYATNSGPEVDADGRSAVPAQVTPSMI